MQMNPISLIEPVPPAPQWQLDRSSAKSATAPTLDASQQAVVDHRGGPLLVLAGPGTGKTTTLTEAVIARLSSAKDSDSEALAPEQVLVLTFARKAAEEIRDRILTRLGGGVVPTVCTFHSLALGIVREFGGSVDRPISLLTAPEQEVRLREILRAVATDERVRTSLSVPPSLTDALETRGLAVEVRNAISRARSLGVGAGELFSAAAGNPEWEAVAKLLGEYLDRIDEQNQLDYNELIVRARELTERPDVRELLRNRYRAIFVDEYQDSDPLQIALLTNLLAPSASLIAVGDPDQSIYAFRGAAVKAVRDFTEQFAYCDLAPTVHSLKVTRRFGKLLRDVARTIIDQNGIDPGVPRDYRDLQTEREGGVVTFTAYDSAEVEAEEVAERIRKRVLSDPQLQWSDVAILVRSGVRSIPVLERALLQAGVPVATSYDDLPLGKEPAVSVLMQLLKAVANGERLKQPDVARFLLSSPLARFTASDLRRIARLVRDHNAAEPAFSEVWLGRALASANETEGIEAKSDADAWARLVALRDLILRVRARAESGASVHELLHMLWTGTSWHESLRRRALSDVPGAAAANHDIDAVRSLFELAATEAQQFQRGGYRGRIDNFVELVDAVAVAASPSTPAVRPNAVSLMTAHRSKGLQWKVVFVCSADEGTWPDLRRRTSMLEPDRLHLEQTSAGELASLGELPDRTQVVSEERRLFYVACTRAEEELHLSSNSADEEAGTLPSRFLHGLDRFLGSSTQEIDEDDEAAGDDLELMPMPRYGVHGLVAQLRRMGTAPAASPELKRQVAARLARLADLRDAAGRALVPAADPRSWWSVADVSASDNAIDDPAAAVSVRGSSLHLMEQCTFNWFLSQRASAEAPTTSAMAFGSIVHAVAQAFIGEGPQPGSAELEETLDQVWRKLRFETDWIAGNEKREALAAIERFALWLTAHNASDMDSEVGFDEVVEVPLPDGGTERFRLKGSIDIVEHTDAGTFIYDIKTGTKTVTAKEIGSHPQLGLYQYAVNRGVVHSGDGSPAQSATLLFLRKPPVRDQVGTWQITQQAVPVSSEPNWVELKLANAIDVVRNERYLPTTGQECSRCSFDVLCPLQPRGKAVIA